MAAIRNARASLFLERSFARFARARRKGRGRSSSAGNRWEGASHRRSPAQNGEGLAGLVFLGYPLLPSAEGAAEAPLGAFAFDCRADAFVQGERDAFGTPTEITPILGRLSKGTRYSMSSPRAITRFRCRSARGLRRRGCSTAWRTSSPIGCAKRSDDVTEGRKSGNEGRRRNAARFARATFAS